MANLVKVGQVQTSFVFLGEHCEIQVTFLDNTAGAPVTVVKPQFQMLDSNKNSVNLRILKPLAPMVNKEGTYKVTFLTTATTPTIGTYDLVFSGYYPDDSKAKNKLEIRSSIEIMTVDSVQTKMDMLQRQVHDHLTEFYQIDDPEKYKFDDGDLYMALKKATDRWNEEPPTTEQGNNMMATIENIPFPAIQMDLAECYLLRPEIILEIWNTITYSDDISFTINRAPMLQSYVNWLLQDCTQRIMKIKKDWIWRNLHIKAIKSTKIPTRALRQMSFIPQLSFISTGGY